MSRHSILGGLAALALASPASAQRLPYLPFDPGWRAPRVAVLPLPIDDRIAPLDFAMDDLAEARPKAIAGVAQDYVPRPAIWRIGDRDTTIWIFGTVHVLPPDFAWRSPALDRVVAGADSLLVESVSDGSESDLYGLSASQTSNVPALSKRVSASHRSKLASLMATLPHEAAELLDTLPTWIAAVAISIVHETRAGEIPGPGADDWIENRFRAAGKPVVAIEDGAKVFASVAAIPETEQRRLLDAALDAPMPNRAQLRAPLHAWARGQVGADSPITVDTGSAALGIALLDDRNAAWAASLRRRLKTPGKILFAAGAGHFIGPASVLARLERSGIRVTRIQ